MSNNEEDRLAEKEAFQREYGPSDYENDPLSPKRKAFGQGWRAAVAKQQAHEATEQRQALAALREIAGGIRLYGAPDQNLLADRIEKRVEELATLTIREATATAALSELRAEVERLKGDLKTARDAALEEALRICEDFGAKANLPTELFYDGATAYECAARIDSARSALVPEVGMNYVENNNFGTWFGPPTPEQNSFNFRRVGKLAEAPDAALSELRTQLQKQALDYLAADTQWIEMTGVLRAEVERYKADAERYRFLRGFASPRSKPLPDEMPLSYYPVRLRCDTAVYSPSTWGNDVDKLVDAARSAASGESAEGST